ncbi:electron transfer flavoprotein subunit alpha [Sulfolobales archaeon HS-7]|nr:electron transfer flavoprotein subunit alpha [Sulfolobales archaeon HS-7]
MRIYVSIKQVPDATDLRIDPITNNLVREGVPAVINPPDYHAIEEAIQLKEKYGGEVIVVTMGPPQAESALREAIAMGADRAYLITDRSLAGADTWATSYAISKAVKKIGEGDLYIFGRRAVDGETEQVGPQTAKWLGLPFVGYTNSIEIKENRAIVTRVTEFEEATLEVPIPFVASVVETANKPRQPSIMKLIEAKRAKIYKLSREDVGIEPQKAGLQGSPTKVIRVRPPPKLRNPQIFDGRGKDDDAAKWLYERIVESLKNADKVESSYVKPKPIAKAQGDVWVYIDHVEGEPNKASFEIMSEAKRIADMLSTRLGALIVGDVDHLIEDAFKYGADVVYYAKVDGWKRYDNDVFTRAASVVIKKYRPEAIFFPGTRISRELASSLAIEVDTGLIADCVSFEVDEKGILYSTRPDFGGLEMSTIICPTAKPVMVTVRPGVFSPIVFNNKGDVITERVEDVYSRFKVLEYKKLERRNVLAESDIVIGIGRGARSPKDISLAEELAKALNGVVGVTKPLSDMGWYPKERQIGQTGTTIRPKLYIALGVSGAIQHMVGIQGSKRIIAVNQDPEAPIFNGADYGVVGDMYSIIPKLIKIVGENGGI